MKWSHSFLFLIHSYFLDIPNTHTIKTTTSSPSNMQQASNSARAHSVDVRDSIPVKIPPATSSPIMHEKRSFKCPCSQEVTSNPVALLRQYQFQSLGVCSNYVSSPFLRRVVMEKESNSEAVNYKLSVLREPNSY